MSAATPQTNPVDQAKANGHAPDLFQSKPVSAKELAAATGYAESTIRQWAAAKKIPSIRRGGRIFFDLEEAGAAIVKQRFRFSGLIPAEPPASTPNPDPWHIGNELIIASQRGQAYIVFGANLEVGRCFIRGHEPCQSSPRGVYAKSDWDWKVCPTIEAAQRLAFGSTPEDAAKAANADGFRLTEKGRAVVAEMLKEQPPAERSHADKLRRILAGDAGPEFQLYQVQHDTDRWWIEAPSLLDAVEAWSEQVRREWGDRWSSDDQPDSVVMIHDGPVLRAPGGVR